MGWVTEQDLAGKDAADHGAVELEGEAPPLGPALPEPSLLQRPFGLGDLQPV